MSADESKTQTEEPVNETQDVEAEATEQEESSVEQEGTDEQDISSEDVSVEELVAQLQASQEEIEKLKEALLRAEAETQNVRRRAEKDVQAAHKYSQEKLVKELLPVKDNLERALEAGADLDDQGPAKAILEGVELTDKSFSDTLVKASVVALNPIGETFDPQQHQAMSMVPSEEVPANTVMTVVQKGYTLNDRLIRPAMVMVSKGSPDGQANIDETA